MQHTNDAEDLGLVLVRWQVVVRDDPLLGSK